MKKTAFVLCLSLSLGIFTAQTARPAPAAAASISVATSFSLGHPVMRRALAPWADEVRSKTGGAIDLRFFNPGVLAPEHEHFSAVRSGRLGAGHGPISASQEELLVTGIMDMPSTMTNCLAASEAFWRLFSASPEIQGEFDGIKVLALHASTPYQLNLSGGNVLTAQDFKNQKLLTSTGGDGARFLRSLGFNPLLTPAQDFAISLSRGMADGCILPMNILRAAKLEDKLSSVSVCDLRMDAYWIGMNMDVYRGLPDGSRKILDELSGEELSLSIARVLNELNNLARSELLKEEIVLNDIPAGERARWIAQGEPALRDNWLTQLTRRGVGNGEEIWNRAQGMFHEAQIKWADRAGRRINGGT